LNKGQVVYMINNMVYYQDSIQMIQSSQVEKFEIDVQTTNKGMMLYDWQMKYSVDVDVQKKGLEVEDEVQIIFFINKGLQWNIEDQRKCIEIQKGETCIYRNRFQSSSTCYLGGYEFLFKSLHIPIAYFKEIVQTLNNQDLEEKILKDISKLTISAPMYSILADMDKGKQYNEGIRSLYLEGKILELLAIYFSELEIGRSKEAYYIGRTDRESIERVREIIDKELIHTPNCEALAKEVQMSRSKLTKLFAAIYDMPIHTYVIHKRLEYAAQLLAEKRVNVTQAAMLSGYSNMSHFSASFKKKYGVLPSEYY